MYHPPLPGPILRAPREGSHTEPAPKAAPQSRRAIMEGILAVSPSSSSVRGGGGAPLLCVIGSPFPCLNTAS